MAYQGFANGLEADALAPRLLAADLPEMLLCSSCSKNFGLYRERIGALSIGVAEMQPSMQQVEQLLEAADLALYGAKRAGGRRQG